MCSPPLVERSAPSHTHTLLKRKLKSYPKESSLDVFIIAQSLLGGWTWIRPRYGQAQVRKSGHIILEKVSMIGPHVSYYLYTKMYCYPKSVFPIFMIEIFNYVIVIPFYTWTIELDVFAMRKMTNHIFLCTLIDILKSFLSNLGHKSPIN